jgi:hypothetical protein
MRLPGAGPQPRRINKIMFVVAARPETFLNLNGRRQAVNVVRNFI